MRNFLRSGTLVAAVCTSCSALAQCPSEWTLAPNSDPSLARYGSAMAMFRDGTSGDLTGPLMFGGNTTSNPALGDQYMWDGASWNQVITSTTPAPRTRHRMVFDPSRNRIVLHGGSTATLTTSNETWEFVPLTGPMPGNWVLRSTSGPSRGGHAMSYDSERQRVVLFGGFTNYIGVFTNDTWELDVNTGVWSQVATIGPSPRCFAAMSFDEARGRTVLQGGYNGTPINDTWEWNGCEWRSVPILSGNAPNSGGANVLTWDSTLGKCVLYGGDTFGTWIFHGTWWQQLVPSPVGFGSYEPCGTFDSRRDKHILFGGYSGPPLADTWELSNRRAPRVIAHPVPVTVTSGTSIGFQVVATGSTPLAFQWRRNGVDIPGATSFFLSLSNVQIADTAAYDCVVTNDCGEDRSNPAAPTITPACPADIDDDGADPWNPDGGVDINDLLFFLDHYNFGC